MIPTPTGLLLAAIGLYLYFQPPVAMLAFACFCTLVPGAAALELPALGGSTVAPVMLSLAFLGLRMLRSDVLRSPGWSVGVTRNSWLLIFCVYTAATAWVLPQMFAGKINLIPMANAVLGFRPLTLTSQNTTQAIDVLGTGFGAVAACALATRSNSPRTLVRAFIVMSWIHIITGILDLVFFASHVSGAFDFARTGSWAQLDQSAGSFHRISALCPEPSLYAAIGATYFVFMCELWLRNIERKLAGAAALSMLIILILSTSSTAYISIGIYTLVLSARAIFIPGSLSLGKALLLVAVGSVLLFGALVAFLAVPSLAMEFIDLIAEMTLRKGQSVSGLERGLWAKQGWDALWQTGGLGVGIGSFRSSNLFMAILGSVGPAGLLLFIGHCIRTFKPWTAATYSAQTDYRVGAGAAAGWTVMISLVPAAFMSPTADPGLLFGLLAGIALGWRSRVIAQPSQQEARRERRLEIRQRWRHVVT